MPWRYDDKTRVQALRMYARGASYLEIEVALGPTRRSVQAWARAAGQPPRRSTRPPVADREAVARDYLAGWTIAEVAGFHGIHPNTVSRWLTQAGVERRRYRRDPELTAAKIRDYANRLGSIRAACRVLGIPRATAIRRLREARAA